MAYTPYLIASLLLAIALACVASFSFWIRRRNSFTTDEKIKSWEAFIKLLSTLTIVTAGAFAFLKYVDQRSVELLQRQAEFEQERFTEMKKTFDDALVTAGSLANADTLESEEAKVSLRNFEDLYWWKLVQYEGPEIASAMVKFRRELEVWQQPEAKKPEKIKDSLLELAYGVKGQLELQRQRVDKLRNLASRGLLHQIIVPVARDSN